MTNRWQRDVIWWISPHRPTFSTGFRLRISERYAHLMDDPVRRGVDAVGDTLRSRLKHHRCDQATCAKLNLYVDLPLRNVIWYEFMPE